MDKGLETWGPARDEADRAELAVAAVGLLRRLVELGPYEPDTAQSLYCRWCQAADFELHGADCPYREARGFLEALKCGTVADPINPAQSELLASQQKRIGRLQRWLRQTRDELQRTRLGSSDCVAGEVVVDRSLRQRLAEAEEREAILLGHLGEGLIDALTAMARTVRERRAKGATCASDS